jgi:glycerate 2-kinase
MPSLETNPMPDAAASERNREFQQMRTAIREIFKESLAQSTIAQAFARNLEYSGGTLRICQDLYPLDSYECVSVVSLGKGAHSMVNALAEHVTESMGGIVVGTTEPESQVRGFRYFKGGHPLPTTESLAAGRATLRYLRNQPENSLSIFLISGGGSAAVEYAVEGIELVDIVETYRVLVHSGAPIAEMNAIRKHLSEIKGGRLAWAATPAQQVSIMISDVPDDALDSLSSGPTMPDSSTVQDCYRIAKKHGMVEKFPAPVRELFAKKQLQETPKKDDPAFARSRWWPILSNSSLLQAAAGQAAAHGFAVEVDNRCDDWDYARAADYLLERVRQLRRGVSKACVVSGGEVTVKVGANAGRGGRNQQFALYCAEKIAGENIAVLSAGTDGIDGNSEAAGAVVDGSTLERVRLAGGDAAEALRRFNADPLFKNIDDAIVTGPTGNNLRDLRVLIAW